MKNFSIIFSVFLLAALFGCKKEKEKEPQPTANKVLVIDNGAQTIQQGARMSNSGSYFQNTTYSATFVDLNGNVTAATNVTWSSSADSIVSINSTSGLISINTVGNLTITASVSDGGVTYTASVPISITLPGIFVVAPSIIMMSTSETIQLTPVYFTTLTGVTYTYTTDNANAVVSVSNTGLVTGVDVGNAVITVKASTSAATFDVPVLVFGVPAVAIPVTSVTLNPAAKDLFKGDIQQFTAKAFSGANDVTANETFTWSSSEPAVASVDSSSGLVTALQIGETVIKATAKGISGYAEVLVNPDTVVLITPFWTSVSAGGTKQFTAAAYDAKQAPISLLTGVTSFNWEIPSFGPGFEIFDIGTVSPATGASTTLTVKADALVGLPGILIASVGGSLTYGSGSSNHHCWYWLSLHLWSG
ncbi:MAG: hypothetical protein FVQ77_16725 [Cytophagales bacterium]|nr:hypothetical protein [Cytophagales bacterium]